tara:strand:+ start:406 stop:684 length:279 start_codon:yes stop_codon:yes gene_type:complete
MSKYFCPYCNPKYQFSLETNGKLVCGLCGEELIKKTKIQFKQLIALFLVFSFSFPMVYIIFTTIINTNKEQEKILANQKTTIRNYKEFLPSV